nr:MAG TPA: hypothetical protein [Caudoviricetes sp.]
MVKLVPRTIPLGTENYTPRYYFGTSSRYKRL